ncbi:MAG: acylphosphatase [Peptococcaceae bacterium]|nr:acylphosphatase [Peptococcaceae bacterium]
MVKARAHLIISGRVQGVYFRLETREQATILGLKGWVRNRSNGTVEIVAEGHRKDINRLIAWCRQGPPMAEVTGVAANWEHYTGEFAGFAIS